jgi:hypothetical protein
MVGRARRQTVLLSADREGDQVAALAFVLFHQRLCGTLANTLLHHQPDSGGRPNGKLEAAYYKADVSSRSVIQIEAA